MRAAAAVQSAERDTGPGEVRISVHAAGVNFADALARAGLYPDAPKPPTVLGYEVAGEIDEVGTDVQGFTEGDRVLALTRFGGYSSAVVVPVHRVKVVPPGKDLRQAAGLPVSYLTAFLTLNRLGSVRPATGSSSTPSPAGWACRPSSCARCSRRHHHEEELPVPGTARQAGLLRAIRRERTFPAQGVANLPKAVATTRSSTRCSS